MRSDEFSLLGEGIRMTSLQEDVAPAVYNLAIEVME